MEVSMKTMLVGLALAAMMMPLAPAAHAQTNYPWCAQYSGGRGGATNCGFTTFEQCLETVRGIGGFCERNNWYQPPPGPHPRRRSQY
jgi:hypothetical protein